MIHGSVSLNAQAQSAEQVLNDRSALDDFKVRLGALHQTVSYLHGIADRACGVQGEVQSEGPAPVANGLLDEIRDVMTFLQKRLDAAVARLSRVA